MKTDETGERRNDGVDLDGGEVASVRISDDFVRISDNGLLDRIELIEAQPLADRAARFDQVYEEMLADLQAGDGTR
jgi:hypothetical protein